MDIIHSIVRNRVGGISSNIQEKKVMEERKKLDGNNLRQSSIASNEDRSI